MYRYVLTFYKKDNMRFISHLDLQTLFQRTIKRGNVKVAYSNGFNPHELIVIVSPLSLGYESTCELLEIDTLEHYETQDLIEALNIGLPEGIKFTKCIETERKNNKTGCNTKFAEYTVKYENIDFNTFDINSFKNQDKIIVLKHDKKTDSYVEKDVKDMVEDIYISGNDLYLKVCCESNKILNPSNLLGSIFKFEGIEFEIEKARITRISIELQ